MVRFTNAMFVSMTRHMSSFNASHKIRSILIDDFALCINTHLKVVEDEVHKSPPLNDYNLPGVTDVRTKYMGKLRNRNIFDADFQRTTIKSNGEILQKSRESIVRTSKEFTGSILPLHSLQQLNYVNHREIFTTLRVHSVKDSLTDELKKYAGNRPYLKIVHSDTDSVSVEFLNACLHDNMQPQNLLVVSPREMSLIVAKQIGCVTCLLCGSGNSIITVDHKIESFDSLQNIVEDYNGISFR